MTLLKRASVVVSVSEIQAAFRRSDDADFATKYGFPKDGGDLPLVLYCLKGKRALDAADKLILLGIPAEKIRIYRGSFADWKARGGRVVQE